MLNDWFYSGSIAGDAPCLGSTIFRASMRTISTRRVTNPALVNNIVVSSVVVSRQRQAPSAEVLPTHRRPFMYISSQLLSQLLSSYKYKECHGARLRSSQWRSPPGTRPARSHCNEAYAADQTAGAPCGPNFHFSHRVHSHSCRYSKGWNR